MRFFAPDVYRAWTRWTAAAAEPVRGAVVVDTDFLSGADGGEVEVEVEGGGAWGLEHGIERLAIDYGEMKQYVVKAKEVVDFEREGSCAICEVGLGHDGGVYALCSCEGCESVAHLSCLSTRFLEEESERKREGGGEGIGEEENVVPIAGTCPSCKGTVKWIDIVKEVTLRMRGEKEVEKLLRVKRARKDKKGAAAAVDENGDEVYEINDDDLDELERLHELNPKGDLDLDMGDSWASLSDSDLSDSESVASSSSRSQTKGKKKKTGLAKKASPKEKKKKKALPAVIEDSDWDDAIVLD